MTSELTQRARLGFLIPETQHTLAFEGVLLLSAPLFVFVFVASQVAQ